MAENDAKRSKAAVVAKCDKPSEVAKESGDLQASVSLNDTYVIQSPAPRNDHFTTSTPVIPPVRPQPRLSNVSSESEEHGLSTDTSTEAALYVAASKVNGETEHEAQANTADGEVPEQRDTASTSASGE